MVLKRFGVLGIVFAKDPQSGAFVFLILHRKRNWTGWELLKGGIEPNESEENALHREIFEESGLTDILIIKKLDTKMVYWDRTRKIQNELTVFLVKASGVHSVSFENNKIAEHDGFEWVRAEDAIRKLKFSDTKRLIRLAVSELEKQTE